MNGHLGRSMRFVIVTSISAPFTLHLLLFAPFKFSFNYFRVVFFFYVKTHKLRKHVDTYRTTKQSCFYKKSEFINSMAKWNGCTTLISRSRVRSFLAIDRQLDDPRGGSLGRTSFDASIALETMPVFNE